MSWTVTVMGDDGGDGAGPSPLIVVGGDGPSPLCVREKSAPIMGYTLKVKLEDGKSISAKGGVVPIELQFLNKSAVADQKFRNAEYRFEILAKDGVQVMDALVPKVVEREIVLKKDDRSTTDKPEVSLLEGKLKAGEEYYLMVSVRNLIGLLKFKAAR